MMVGDPEEKPMEAKPDSSRENLLTLDQHYSTSDIFVSISGLIGQFISANTERAIECTCFFFRLQ